MDIDGLAPEDAVRLCTRRHNELSGPDLKFLTRLHLEKIKQSDAVRLTGIVRKLRQGDLVAALARPE